MLTTPWATSLLMATWMATKGLGAEPPMMALPMALPVTTSAVLTAMRCPSPQLCLAAATQAPTSATSLPLVAIPAALPPPLIPGIPCLPPVAGVVDEGSPTRNLTTI